MHNLGHYHEMNIKSVSFVIGMSLSLLAHSIPASWPHYLLPGGNLVAPSDWKNTFVCHGGQDTKFNLKTQNINPYGFSAKGIVAGNPYDIKGKLANLGDSSATNNRNQSSIVLTFHTKTANPRIPTYHYTGIAKNKGITRKFTCLPNR